MRPTEKAELHQIIYPAHPAIESPHLLQWIACNTIPKIARHRLFPIPFVLVFCSDIDAEVPEV